MIRGVEVTSDGCGGIESAEIRDVFDDGEKNIEHKMTVTRSYGEATPGNPEGTDKKIEVYGNFTYRENEKGEMIIDEYSQDAIDEAVAVFRVIFGEKMPD